MADALTLYLMSKLSTYPVVPVAVTASTSCVAGSLYVVSISTAAVVMTLPTPANGACIGVQTRAITTGSVTITASSGVIFGPGTTSAGFPSIPLSAQNAEVLLLADGTNWNIIAGAMDSGWMYMSLVNSWSYAGGGWSVPGYRLEGNLVRLRGLAYGGVTNTTVATLPAAFRPPSSFICTTFTTSSGGASAQLSCLTSGVINITFPSGGFCGFDNISFTVD